MLAERIIDCHAHIVDPARFPFGGGPGYKPRAHETGTHAAFSAVLDYHGVQQALLVQLSGYGFDNAAIVDAMARSPGRFKAIAMVDPLASESVLETLAAAGVVGVRFNLVSYDRDALTRPGARTFLARLKAFGWFAQVFAHDAQWPEIAATLRASGVRVLVDHFGIRDIAGGIDQRGFQAVLALGRDGCASVKLSAPFRLSHMPGDFRDLDPFVEALLAAFGPDGCIWGSDWPFIGVPAGPDYAGVLAPIRRWLPDSGDRDRVLWRNPVRLFGFGSVAP